jgi:hypothetical protein
VLSTGEAGAACSLILGELVQRIYLVFEGPQEGLAGRPCVRLPAGVNVEGADAATLRVVGLPGHGGYSPPRTVVASPLRSAAYGETSRESI